VSLRQALSIHDASIEDVASATAAAQLREPTRLPWDALVAWLTLHVRAGGEHNKAAEQAARASLGGGVARSPEQRAALSRFLAVDVLLARGAVEEAQAWVGESGDLSEEARRAVLEEIELHTKAAAAPKPASSAAVATAATPSSSGPGAAASKGGSKGAGLFPPPPAKRKPELRRAHGEPIGDLTVSEARRVSAAGSQRKPPPSLWESVIAAMREAVVWVQGHAPALSIAAAVVVVLLVLQRLSRISPSIRRGFEMLGATLKQALFFR